MGNSDHTIIIGLAILAVILAMRGQPATAVLVTTPGNAPSGSIPVNQLNPSQAMPYIAETPATGTGQEAFTGTTYPYGL